jgi:hypothetical protein
LNAILKILHGGLPPNVIAQNVSSTKLLPNRTSHTHNVSETKRIRIKNVRIRQLKEKNLRHDIKKIRQIYCIYGSNNVLGPLPNFDC